MSAAPDAPAKLVKLRQPEAVRAVDHDDAGVGNVHADFGDRGRHQHVELVVAELLHDRVFFAGLHAPVQQADFVAEKDAAVRCSKASTADSRFNRLRGFDQRIDDERLPSFFKLRFDEVIGALALRRLDHARADRDASRRHLVDDRQVEVGVERQRQRARDRRGGHDQQVRICAFAAQRAALFDAEAVLLVDDGDARDR